MQESRWAVPGNRALSDDAIGVASKEERGQGNQQSTKGDHQLCAEPRRARQEGLDQDTEQGGDQHDQDWCQVLVLKLRDREQSLRCCGQTHHGVVSFVDSAGLSAVGSGFTAPTRSRVDCTAGSMTRVTAWG